MHPIKVISPCDAKRFLLCRDSDTGGWSTARGEQSYHYPNTAIVAKVSKNRSKCRARPPLNERQCWDEH